MLGGQAEQITEALEGAVRRPAWSSATRVKLGATVLGADATPLTADQLEVALLDRSRPRRAFRRIKNDELDRAARLSRRDASVPAQHAARSVRAISTNRISARDHSTTRHRRGAPVGGRSSSRIVVEPRRPRSTSSTMLASSIWSSGTYTSTRAMSPTVSPYGPSSAPRSSHVEALVVEPGRQHVGPERSATPR